VYLYSILFPTIFLIHMEDYRYGCILKHISTGGWVWGGGLPLPGKNYNVIVHFCFKTYYSFLYYDNTSYLLFIYCLFFIIYFIFICLRNEGNSFLIFPLLRRVRLSFMTRLM